jgi:hypothetical protein
VTNGDGCLEFVLEEGRLSWVKLHGIKRPCGEDVLLRQDATIQSFTPYYQIFTTFLLNFWVPGLELRGAWNREAHSLTFYDVGWQVEQHFPARLFLAYFYTKSSKLL